MAFSIVSADGIATLAGFRVSLRCAIVRQFRVNIPEGSCARSPGSRHDGLGQFQFVEGLSVENRVEQVVD
jgi:hypothetical protein